MRPKLSFKMFIHFRGTRHEGNYTVCIKFHVEKNAVCIEVYKTEHHWKNCCVISNICLSSVIIITFRPCCGTCCYGYRQVFILLKHVIFSDIYIDVINILQSYSKSYFCITCTVNYST